MIEIKIDAQRLNTELGDLGARLSDPAPLMQNVASLLESTAQEAFRTETAADGRAWASLADSTIAERTDKGQWPGQKLVRKGASNGLLGSLFSDHGSDWATVGAGSGPSAAYAMIHQFGGQAGRGRKVNIPARPFLPITDGELSKATEENCLELVMEYLQP